MRARYYDPSSKRFLGQDILLGNIQEIKSLNRYAYVQGNPMKYIDPTGLHPFEGGSYEGDSNSYNKRGDILGQKKKHKTRTTNPQEIWNLTKSKTTEQLYEISQNCNDPNARNALQAIHLRNRLTGQTTQRNLQRRENFTNSAIWAAKRVHAVPGMGVAYTSYEGLYVTITGDIDSYNFNNLSAEDYYTDWEFRQMSGITSSVIFANFLYMAGLDQSIFSSPGDEQASSPSTAEIANSPEAQQREIVKSNLGNEYDITQSENHSKVHGSGDVQGEPNSSVDIYDRQGELVTRRWYGPEGRAYRDIDFTQHGNPSDHPEFPHEHFWDWTDPDDPNRP